MNGKLTIYKDRKLAGARFCDFIASIVLYSIEK
jgi:hypothetical protein